MTADIAAVQAKLDAAKTTIETDYAEVAEQFTADIAALQEDVDSISNEVKGLYDEVKLTAESQIDTTKPVSRRYWQMLKKPMREVVLPE